MAPSRIVIEEGTVPMLVSEDERPITVFCNALAGSELESRS